MNRIERYLGRVVISHTLLVLMVLLIILGFGEFMMQLGMLKADYTLVKGTLYSLLKLPVFGYEIFPIALLIGTLLGLGSLANHSELTVLRVTGWSIGRIFMAVLKSALLLWLLVAIIGEIVAPKAETYATKLRAESLQQNISLGDHSGFWMKDAERLIHVQRIVSVEEMHGLTVYELRSGQIVGVAQASRAVYRNGEWLMNNVRQQQLSFAVMQFGEQPYESLNLNTQRLASWVQSFPLDPDLLDSLRVETRYMRLDDLYAYIGFLQQNNLDAAPYQLEFWRKLASPLVVMGMMALVFPLIFGSQRQVSMGQRIFVGILIGMGFHLINQIFGNLSVVYQVPAVLGAFVPSLLLLGIALILFKRLR